MVSRCVTNNQIIKIVILVKEQAHRSMEPSNPKIEP